MTRGTAGLVRENCRDCLQNQRRDILLEQLMHGHQGKGIPDQVFQLPSGASGCHLVLLDILAQEEPNKMVSSTGSNHTDKQACVLKTKMHSELMGF
jgi:hypothetical protein